jgi:ABC-type multidrug transport system ATPase subunit
MSESAIEVSNVTVRYGRLTAVDEVTLNVPRGSVYALLGRNGAGKSSLVRCLLGQRQPDAGVIRAFGQDVWTRRAALMQRIGVVSEEADAPPEMTIDQLERFCSELYAHWDHKEINARFDRFEVSRRSRFGALSKGQKKQVLLALALAMSPELLVLDDPTLGLDVVARKSLFEEVIAELADRGITVFLTTHDLAGIETLADRVAIMRDGAAVVEEDLDALKARFRRIRFAAEPDAFAETAPLSLEDIFIAISGEGAQS